MKSGIAAFLLALAALPLRAGEGERAWSLGGYYKNFSLFLSPASYDRGGDLIEATALGAVNNRLRLEATARLSAALSLEVEYDLSARIQDPGLFQESALFSGGSSLEYRWADFTERLYPAPESAVQSFGLFHNLDRFVLTVRTGPADVFLGRQAISWGSGRVVNPTDVLAPFAFNELDKEERRGVDALRVRVPLGMMDEFDFGIVAGREFKAANNALFLRLKTYLLKTDLSIMAVAFRRHLLLGFDLARSVGQSGIWLEAAWVSPYAFQRGSDSPGPAGDFVRISLGLDRNLSGTLYAFVEYHYNGAGRPRPEEAMPLLRTPAYRDGSVYLFGLHYLTLGSVYQVTPLTPLTWLFILNLGDGSLMLAPFMEYNVAENIYLAAGAYVGLGKRPEHIPGPLDIPPLLLHSEFGAYPKIVFTSFRIYF